MGAQSHTQTRFLLNMFLISEERQGGRASISFIHGGPQSTAGSQATGPRSRPGSMARLHTGTGLNFPEKVEKELSASCLRRLAHSRCRAGGQQKHMTAGSEGQDWLCTRALPALNQQRAAGGQPQAAEPHLPGDCSPSCQAEIKVIDVSLGDILCYATSPSLDPVKGQASK